MSGKTFEEVLQYFPDAKERTLTEWRATCPTHDDNEPSLDIKKGIDGRTLLICRAHCDTERIVEAVGLTMRDLFPPREAEKEEVAAYDYRDADGNVLYQSVRFEPKDFRQRRPLTSGGWEWNLRGVQPVPFALPEVIAAVEAGERIWIVEGEKDALRLAQWGLAATTNAGGAGKWRGEFAPWFKGAEVVILPDNDAPGEKHAKQVARLLYGFASHIRIIPLPNLPKKGDVSDWIAEGGTREELEELAGAADETDEVPTTDDSLLLKNFDIEQIEKVNSEDPVYRVHLMGGIVETDFATLASFPQFRKAVGERLDRMIDMRNPNLNWYTYLDRCLQNKLEVLPAPEEAGEQGMLWYEVSRYLTKRVSEDESMLAEFKGAYSNERFIYFHGPTLRQFLTLRGVRTEAGTLWNVLQKRGAESMPKTCRDSEGQRHVVRAWRIPKDAVADPEESGNTAATDQMLPDEEPK